MPESVTVCQIRRIVSPSVCQKTRRTDVSSNLVLVVGAVVDSGVGAGNSSVVLEGRCDGFRLGGGRRFGALKLVPREFWVAGGLVQAAFGALDLLQQSPTALLGTGHPSSQRDGERDLDQEQRDEPAEQCRRELGENPAAVIGDFVETKVRLEEHWRALAGSDPAVDLQQLAVGTFVAILRLGQIREVGGAGVAFERFAFLGTERIALADERLVVGVDDPPITVPDLHADHLFGDHPLTNHHVESVEDAAITMENAVGDHRSDVATVRLDHPAGVADGLGRRDPPSDRQADTCTMGQIPRR